MGVLGGLIGFADSTISDVQQMFGNNVKKSSGIVNYTRSSTFSKYGSEKGNLCNANLLRNYSGGNMLLEKPFDIDNNNFFIYNDTSTNPEVLRKPYIIRENVGDLFGLADEEYYHNSTKKIVTVDGFTNFESAIRNNIIRFIDSFYKKNYGEGSFLSEIELYDSLQNYNSSEYLKISDATNSGNMVEYYKELTIKSSTTNDTDYRGKINKDLEKKGLLNSMKNIWYIYEPKSDDDDLDYYSIESPWTVGNVIHIKKFKGSLSYPNTYTGKRNYSYYQERDGEGNGPTTLNSSDGIGSTESIVYIDESNDDGISRMIRNTNKVFRNLETKTLINRFHTNNKDDDFGGDELISSFSKYGLSRGRNLLTKQAEYGNEGESINGYDNPYCRVWTAHHQYNKLYRRLRPFYNGKNALSISDIQSDYGTSLRPNGKDHLEANTVLTKQGFVRITPSWNNFKDGKIDVKKYMFSLENLAWKDIHSSKLSPEQRGPNGGRIMWFPPYNLKFTENVNVDWNSNKFIGRGEQIYTYTNTDRSGTLSFTLLIDHPMALNKFVGNNQSEPKEVENDILRFFAGCENLNGSSNGSSGDNNPPKPEPPKLEPPKPKRRTKDIAICCFFPNNWSGSNFDKNPSGGLATILTYEVNNTNTPFENGINDIDTGGVEVVFTNHDYNYSLYGLNKFTTGDSTYKEVQKRLFSDRGDDFEFYSLNSSSGITSLDKVITSRSAFGYGNTSGGSCDYKIDSIDIYGSASSHGKKTDPGNKKNNRLSKRRGEFLKSLCLHKNSFLKEEDFNGNVRNVITPVNDDGIRDINSLDAKIARSAYVVFHISWSESSIPTNSSIESDTKIVREDPVITDLAKNNPLKSEKTITRVNEIVSGDYSYDNEYKYFAEMRADEVVYKYIAEKVKYFDPTFHSITPEGFNSRLTFLHQCTRQGPTMDLSSGRVDSSSNNLLKYAGNLAFGRPPYCILRIGDFFHTKICITSLSIDYDTGGGIQWDLNPEGIGVQPMYANININFNFIGGQDLVGPIERLQNAVTANYYANASVYDNKADVKSNKKGKSKVYDPTK